MTANAAAAGELERAEEIIEGNPMLTLELALSRAPSTSSRADHKKWWPSLGYKSVINPPRKFPKKYVMQIKQ